MDVSILIDPKQKAPVIRQGFGFWSMNSPGKWRETRAVKGSSKLHIRCSISTGKCYSLQMETCSDMGKKKHNLPDTEEGAGIQSDCHGSLKLPFLASRQKKVTETIHFPDVFVCFQSTHTQRTTFRVLSSITMFLYVICLLHLITCMCYFETCISL